MKSMFNLSWKPLCLLGFLMWCCALGRAEAHWADMAALEMDISERSAQAHLNLPVPFFTRWDDNRDGQLNPAEINRHQQAIGGFLQQHIGFEVGEQPVTLQLASADKNTLSPPGRVSLNLSWSWSEPSQDLRLRYDLFPEDAPMAHCLVSLQHQGKLSSLVFDREHAQQRLIPLSWGEQVAQFGLLGLEHIVTGYDHLLFLFALLLASQRLIYLLKIVTTFTLAHSFTLSLAVLGLVQAPSRWIEVLIAASIIYVVVVEGLWKQQETPWYVVFAFGLIHGLGFASVLQEMNLPTPQLATALLSFNLGIEAGQLVTVCLFWGLMQFLSRFEDAYPRIQKACAVGILGMATFWLFERMVGA
ncbi:MAG: HupE/UreJ family protein [Candidatus Sericytochromatia bacterium]